MPEEYCSCIVCLVNHIVRINCKAVLLLLYQFMAKNTTAGSLYRRASAWFIREMRLIFAHIFYVRRKFFCDLVLLAYNDPRWAHLLCAARCAAWLCVVCALVRAYCFGLCCAQCAGLESPLSQSTTDSYWSLQIFETVTQLHTPG